MKNLLLICCIVFISFTSKASHLMGGDLIVKYDSTNSDFYIELTNYRDTLGIPAYLSSSCDVYKYDTATNSYVYTSVTIPLSNTSGINWGVLITGMPYGVEIYSYRSAAGTLASTFASLGIGKYRFVVYDCCRNAAILNLTSPGGDGLLLKADFEYLGNTNNTPQCLAIPVIFGPINSVWNYNPFPFDADGDSIAWSLNTPYGSTYSTASSTLDTCLGYVLPSGNVSNPFSLNPITGEITWKPNMVGNFVASFKIDEYNTNGSLKGSTIRDMQYVVIPDSNGGSCGNRMPQFSTVTPFNINTANNYSYIYYTPGMPLTFSINGTDPDLTNVLSMESISDLFSLNNNPATFSYAANGNFNSITGTFKWTPTATETKDNMVVFRVKDGTFIRDFTLVLKKSNTPLSITNTLKNNLQIALAPNPIINNEINLIGSDATQLSDATIRICSMNGRVIKEVKTGIISSKNVNIRDINLGSGFYLIEVTKKGYVKQNLNFYVL